MTIEELKQTVENLEINDLAAHAEDTRDVMLMLVDKLDEIERWVRQTKGIK